MTSAPICNTDLKAKQLKSDAAAWCLITDQLQRNNWLKFKTFKKKILLEIVLSKMGGQWMKVEARCSSQVSIEHCS